VKALPNGTLSVRDRKLERLRNIVGMHVVNGFHTEVRKQELVAVRELREHRGIEVPGRVEWRPAGADNVTRVKNPCSDYFLVRGIEQPLFDRRLFYPIVAEGLARL
jgi:hypothetical protein